MKHTSIIVGVLLLLALAGAWYWMSSQQQPSLPIGIEQTQSVTQSLTLTKRTLTPNMVTVTQGDQVTIRVMSDEAGEFHLSGYEIENGMTVGTELSFSFTADKAGRYNFELHPKAGGAAEAHDATDVHAEEDVVVGAFVVNPR